MEIGDHPHIDDFCVVSGKPRIGRNVYFAGCCNVGRHCIVGTNLLVFPGVTLAEGCSVGAMSMVTKSTEPWSVYFGAPARKLKARRKDLLALEQEYLRKQAQA